MKTIFASLILFAQFSMANTYGLECNSTDMTVSITNGGYTTIINGEEFSSEPYLSDAIAASPSMSFADLSVVAADRPITVGSQIDSLGCRTSYVQFFDQTFNIIDNKSKRTVLTKQFVCESRRVQFASGADCSRY